MVTPGPVNLLKSHDTNQFIGYTIIRIGLDRIYIAYSYRGARPLANGYYYGHPNIKCYGILDMPDLSFNIMAIDHVESYIV